MGIDMERVVRKARSLPNTTDMVPKDLAKGIETRLMVGDVNGLTKDEFVETIEWLSEEFADEIDDPDAHIPYDQKDTRFLYLPNPRELGMNLLHLTNGMEETGHGGEMQQVHSQFPGVRKIEESRILLIIGDVCVRVVYFICKFFAQPFNGLYKFVLCQAVDIPNHQAGFYAFCQILRNHIRGVRQ